MTIAINPFFRYEQFMASPFFLKGSKVASAARIVGWIGQSDKAVGRKTAESQHRAAERRDCRSAIVLGAAPRQRGGPQQNDNDAKRYAKFIGFSRGKLAFHPSRRAAAMA